MARRFIDDYDVLLLDMGKTFMFNADRMRNADEVTEQYRLAGGALFDDGEVARIIAQLETIGEGYGRDSSYVENYPGIAEMLREIAEAAALPPEEEDRIVRVFALQERGVIPAEYVETLRALRKTHRLGVVSNVWAPSSYFHEVFDETGITGLFDVIVFSSDSGVIKPSPRIFEKALAAFSAPLERVVYIGDSHKRDVVGARAAGIGSVWITSDPASAEGAECQPDLVIRDLTELPGAPAG